MAWSGDVVAEFNDFNEMEMKAEGTSGLPLLEIYHPILQPWSGDVEGRTYRARRKGSRKPLLYCHRSE